jgi:transposase
MSLSAPEQLEGLSQPELIGLVRELLLLVKQQQAEIAQLKAEIAQLKQPPPTSRNSSQPPSRDQKAQTTKSAKKKQGPPFGHARYQRPLIAHPDRLITAQVSVCQSCQADLQNVAPVHIERRQITELPVVRPLVFETQQHEVICPHCHTLNLGVLPPGLAAARQFGPQLEGTVVYLKQQQHLSYERIVQALHDLYRLSLSEGGASSIVERASRLAAPVAAQIKEQVRRSPHIQSDETSARVAGDNWWQWVFRSAAGVYHTIVPRRNAQVIADFMGDAVAEVWNCDCFSAQLKAPAELYQLCLAHQLRELQRVLDEDAQHTWAAAAQQLFREAIHLKNRFACAQPELTWVGYWRRVTELENRLDRLLEVEVDGTRASGLRNRFALHRDKLLIFLYYPDVPPTNNASEQALRPSVVHRKVTNGFRSEWGAQGYAALQSIIATAKLKGQDVFTTLVELMGAPLLPYLESATP